ncbi:MAG: phosphoribosyltransferase family protein [Niabella sp.]
MAERKNYILTGEVIEKKLQRLALEVVEQNIEEKEITLVGIAPYGVVMAKIVQELIQKWSSISTKLITLKIDKVTPGEVELDASLDIKGKVVVVVDDVTNSGKTLLYSMKPFLEHHPKKVQIMVLVERSHKAYPVSADYKGISLATTLQEHIFVEVEGDKITGAYMK